MNFKFRPNPEISRTQARKGISVRQGADAHQASNKIYWSTNYTHYQILKIKGVWMTVKPMLFFSPHKWDFIFFCIFFLQANLRRLDFTGNLIEDIEDGTFSKLSLLEELTLAENQLLKLPVLPPKLTLFNAKYNKIKSRGIKANTFKVSILYYDQTVCFIQPMIM